MRVAVVGASKHREKWGYKLLKSLIQAGCKVYPINPKYDEIDNMRCYPNLESLPEKPDMVITVVPPSVTEKIVRECKKLGIRHVWMQPGSESKEAIEFCKRNGIDVVYNACFLVESSKRNFKTGALLNK